MPLPSDVSTFTLQGGPYTDAAGYVVASGVTGTLVPVDGNLRPTQVVHTADGATIVPESVPITIGAGGTWSVAGLAHTDDPHLSPTGFLYQVTWKLAGYRSTLTNKTFAVPVASGASVDFDLLASSTTAAGILVPVGVGPPGPSGPTGPQGPAGRGMLYARLVQSVSGINVYSGIPSAIDGVVPSVGDIVLLTAETSSVNNGLWTVQSGAWTRPDSFASGTSALGAVVAVYDGNSHPGGLWAQQGGGSRVVDTDGLSFTEYRYGSDRGPAVAFSLYYPGDVVTLGSTRVLITKPCQAASGGAISSSNYVLLSYLQVVDIRAYGAKVDATTDDTAAIQAAINSFGTQGTSNRGVGGVVFFPSGTTRTSAPLDVPSNVHLRGTGWASSVIQLLPGSNCDMIRLHKSTGSGNSNAFWSSVQDLMLDGRNIGFQQGTSVSDITFGAAGGSTSISSAGQHTFAVGEIVQGVGVMPGTTISAVGTPATSATLSQPLLNTVVQNGTAGTGQVLIGGDSSGRPWAAIYHETNPYNTGQSGDNQFDPSHLIRNVWIYAMAGDGIRVHGRSDVTIDHVKVSFPQGSAFVIDFDTSLYGCIAEKPTGHGLWLAGHSSNRITNCKFYNSYGYGVYAQGSGSVGDITLGGVDIQQANSHGLYLQGYGVPVAVQGITVAQAGFSNAAQSVASGTDICSVVLDGVSNAIVDAACSGDAVALKVINSSAGNDVRITHSSTVSGTRDLSANNQASLGTNRIVVNGTVVNPVPSLANLTGDVAISSPSDTQLLQYNTATGKWKNASVGGFVQNYGGLLGDGSDGALTLDGTTNPSTVFIFSAPNYTLKRDLYCSSLTINSGVILNTAGSRIYCTGTVTNNGTIAYNGNAGAANGTAGAVVSGSFLGNAGGGGGTAGGTAGPGAGIRYGVGAGGAGGNGASGTGAAGGFTNSAAAGVYRDPTVTRTGVGTLNGVALAASGGAGGGGGAGDGTNKGGGGGAGGGLIAVLASAVTNSGSISATGGTGGTPTTGNCGGGGGGGGGGILIYTLTAWTNTGSTAVTGGAPGSGVGTGAVGIAGTNGAVTNFIVT